METLAESAQRLKRLRLISVPGIVAFCVLLLCPSFPLSAAMREKNSARAGDLQFFVTSVETPETVLGRGRAVPNRPISGHHFVVVHVKAKNLGKRAACAYFTARLKAEFDIVVRRDLVFDEGPSIHELLPGEETEGRYIFEVKDGVRPLELIMEPQGKQGCGTGPPTFFLDKVQISLKGI